MSRAAWEKEAMELIIAEQGKRKRKIHGSQRNSYRAWVHSMSKEFYGKLTPERAVHFELNYE